MRIHADENIQVQNTIETDFRKIVNVFNLLCKHVLGEFSASVNYLRGLDAILFISQKYDKFRELGLN
jgi:hypothetical protein